VHANKMITTGITTSCTYFLCLLLNKVASLFCPSEAQETSQIFSRIF